ncbi:MAG TPA: gamma-glutamyltransferase [Gemmatimonadaceae bacterium]|nr:gamma-glutamyltransferase [Gemmatimonadaceae bacterium]
MRHARFAVVLIALAACHPKPAVRPLDPAGPAIPARVTPSFPAEWPFRAGATAPFAEHGMVSSNERTASEAGVEILRQGGNAVDAAVAVGFALAVTYPEAGNIGGGGYMVIRMADGRTAALDYREVAPLAATRNMYLDSAGKLTDKSLVGHLASGVPGAPAGLVAAQKRYGALSLRAVMAPAIRLAEQGFVVDSALGGSLSRDAGLIGRFAGGALFIPGGSPLRPGATLRQPDLARTLRAIADQGADGFYRGPVADSLVAEMKRGGGIITLEDLRRYAPVWRDAVRSTYRGYTLFTMPPSSSGGVTVTETLNLMETVPTVPAFGSAEYAHLLGSAYQRAFIDRNEKLADPAFASVPVAKLTSKEYARALAATIGDHRATPTAVIEAKARTIREGSQTTHYSVVDGAGNAVATTTTINGLFGSGVWVRGAGFFLNNEMDDFAAQPGMPNQFGLVQGEANAIQPGKRMLSAMSPTIVLDPSGDLLLVVGARGGPRIITATSQIILDVIDHRMSLADAMSAPRIHHQALPDSLRYERRGLRQSTIDSLTAMGYAVGPVGSVAQAHAVMRVKGGWQGFVDPRGSGAAVGY